MVDQYDDGRENSAKDALTPLNLKKIPKNQVAVAIENSGGDGTNPYISAAGRGKIAEQILQLAFDNGIKVREDGALAEMLAMIELDSPVPPDAFMAVAEILSYVYKANGEPNPFDAVLQDAMDKETQDKRHDD
ncbi:MAG: EscU/YscU/HrcU family type III secretion system export apparatus switch protein [Rhodospirillales bacterium]|nr:EscU/YscU/HrcU family type III secretion system export apparatus switch protein [Rhodospirillales bacterium]